MGMGMGKMLGSSFSNPAAATTGCSYPEAQTAILDFRVPFSGCLSTNWERHLHVLFPCPRPDYFTRKFVVRIFYPL